MNDEFMEKVADYAERLVLEEMDKCLSGEKHEFSSFYLSRKYLFMAIDKAESFLSERQEFRKKIIDLENRLFSSTQERYMIADNATAIKAENHELKKKVKGLEAELARAKGLLNTIYGRSKL